MDERETPEVGQSFVYAGLQTGSFEVFDLRTRSSVYKSTPTSSAPINAISYLPSQHLLASGSSDGVITIYDVRSLSSPLTSFRRNDANVTDLEFALPSLSQDTNNIDKDGYDVGLAISTSDGLPYVANLIPEGPGVKAELVGVDCDPVKSIRVRGGGVTGNTEMEVWTASDDAIVRRYVF
jgi:proteasomal ATPase-associated factor 1